MSERECNRIKHRERESFEFDALSNGLSFGCNSRWVLVPRTEWLMGDHCRVRFHCLNVIANWVNGGRKGLVVLKIHAH